MSQFQDIELQNFDIVIKADGRWFHEGGEIKRLGLVKLFASVLSCDDEGRYWLTTPVERGQITVDDAPFVIQSLRCVGKGRAQQIFLRDNLDVEYLLSAKTPLVLRASSRGYAKPYLRLEKGLSALIKHAVFYEMADIALADGDADGAQSLLWSDGVSFALELNDEADA